MGLLRIFSIKYNEVRHLDNLLKQYDIEGHKEDLDYLYERGERLDIDRLYIRLIEDGMLRRYGDFDYVITSQGKEHIDKGGYKVEFIWQVAKNRWTFILSIIAILISLFALVF